MIKINLLGLEAGGDEDRTFYLACYFGSLIILLLAVGWIYLNTASQVGDLDIEASDLKSKLEKLKIKTKEVRDLEKKKAELGAITSSIGRLKLIQMGPVHMFSNINTSLTDKVWLQQISLKGDVVNLDGYSVDDFNVAEYMKRLEKLGYFTDVSLKESVTVSLVHFTAYNNLDGTVAKYVAKLEDESKVQQAINEEARKSGLMVVNGKPPVTAQSVANKVLSTTTDQGNEPKLLGFGSGGIKRDSKVYVWKAFQKTEAKAFKINAKFNLMAMRIFLTPPNQKQNVSDMTEQKEELLQ